MIKTQIQFLKGQRLQKTVYNRIHNYARKLYLCTIKKFINKWTVAMGSPLAPLLANQFITSKENTQLKNNVKTKPIFYTRYVDDTFVLMENNHDSVHPRKTQQQLTTVPLHRFKKY